MKVQTHDSSGIPIFLILFDELSATVLEKDGEIDPSRHPNFHALACDSAQFTCASTNHLLTRFAVPTLLTGKTRPRHDDSTLFEHLPPTYQCEIIESVPLIEEWLYGHGLPRDRVRSHGTTFDLAHRPLAILRHTSAAILETLVPSPLQGLVQPSLGMTPSFYVGIRRQMNSLKEIVRAEPKEGLFVYWHLMAPHAPFVYDRRGELRPSRNAEPWNLDTTSEGLLQNYGVQVQWADRILGEIIQHLRQEGFYDRALIIVTSDHGLRTVGHLEPQGFPEVIGPWTPFVPLFIRAPTLPRVQHDTDYQHIDLVPTLLELAGIPYDKSEFDGLSVLATQRPAREKEFFTGTDRYVYDPRDCTWHRRAKNLR